MSLRNITTQDFDSAVLSNDKTVLVDFYASWCPPCKMLAPELEKVAAERNGINDIVKIDVDENGELARKFGVMSIPTMVIIKGGQEVDRIVGFRNASQLVETLKSHD